MTIYGSNSFNAGRDAYFENDQGANSLQKIEQPWVLKVIDGSVKVSESLRSDILKVRSQLIDFPYTVDYRMKCFASAMYHVKKDNFPTVLYSLICDSESRTCLINLVTQTDFDDGLFYNLKLILFKGDADLMISMKLLNHGIEVSKNEIRNTSTQFLGEVCGRFVKQWQVKVNEDQSECEKITFRALNWLKTLIKSNENEALSTNGVVDYLMDHFSEDLRSLLLISKQNTVSCEVYNTFFYPFLFVFSKTEKGCSFIREVLSLYSQDDSLDAQFFTKVLFLDESPCEVSKKHYLTRVFNKTFSRSNDCRNFVNKTTQCMVGYIDQANKTAPKLTQRYLWQYHVKTIFKDEVNCQIYNKIQNLFVWAMHFAEVPNDVRLALEHRIDFKTVIDNFSRSELVSDSETFEVMFEMLSTSPTLLQKLIKKFPERSKELLEKKMAELCDSFFIPKLNNQQRATMKLLYPAINIRHIEHKHKRSVENTLLLFKHMERLDKIPILSPFFDGYEALFNALEKYPKSRKFLILTEVVKALANVSCHSVRQIFQQLDQNDLTLLVSNMWQKGVLTEELFDKIFPEGARVPFLGSYKKFLKAIDALIQKDEIRETLKIKEDGDGSFAVPVIVSSGVDIPCVIQ